MENLEIKECTKLDSVVDLGKFHKGEKAFLAVLNYEEQIRYDEVEIMKHLPETNEYIVYDKEDSTYRIFSERLLFKEDEVKVTPKEFEKYFFEEKTASLNEMIADYDNQISELENEISEIRDRKEDLEEELEDLRKSGVQNEVEQEEKTKCIF